MITARKEIIMSRVIKFRGLGINGHWYYGLLAESKGDRGQQKKGLYISNSVGMPWAYQVRPETVGEFTGLHDKNKQEIWEGDIVRHWSCTQKSFNREVIFQWGMFGFLDAIKQFNPIGTSLGNKPDNTGYVVIGDIYQNPELLESNR